MTWTRLAIVTFAADHDGFDATAARLLQNQVDIGDAIKPFYGDAAGAQLTALLHDHITIAVKAGDTDAFERGRLRRHTRPHPRHGGRAELRPHRAIPIPLPLTCVRMRPFAPSLDPNAKPGTPMGAPGSPDSRSESSRAGEARTRYGAIRR